MITKQPSRMLAVLLILACGCESRPSKPVASPPSEYREVRGFKVESEFAVGEEAFAGVTLFQGRYACDISPDDFETVDAVFDLDANCWTELDPWRRVTIRDCEQWANALVEQPRDVNSTTSRRAARVAESLLEPNFRVFELSSDELSMTSEFFTYFFSKPLELKSDQKASFFDYDRLSAYRKSMMPGQLPPFTQLAITEELRRRQFVPALTRLDAAIAETNVEIVSKVRVSALTDAEEQRIATAVREVELRLKSTEK